MVVRRQARRARPLAVKRVAAGREGGIQAGGFGPEQHQGPDRGQRGKLAGSAVVGDQQPRDVKQRQQLGNRAGVAGQINHGAAG